MIFLKTSETLKIFTTPEIIRNEISTKWYLPYAPVMDFCNVCIFTYAFMYACIFVCTYVYVYEYVYEHVYTRIYVYV